MDRRLFPTALDLTRLHTRAMAEQPVLDARLAIETLGEAVARSLGSFFDKEGDGAEPPAPDEPRVSRYLESLHAGDLGLATICDHGDERGWEHLIGNHRPMLYRAASVIAADETGGRELADTLWAELYGVGHTRASVQPGTERRSLLRYFHGRSQLATWLRSVLAQRHVDRIRADRRTRSLDDDPQMTGGGAVSAAARVVDAHDPDRARSALAFQEAMSAALESIEPRDRLRVGLYYGQRLTLAEVGRLMDEHEATASRKLARTRAQLRTKIEHVLRDRYRMTPEEIQLCYQYAVEDPSFDISAVMTT